MKKTGIIGHFAFGKKMFDGQTVKTRVLADALQKKLGEDHVSYIDTHGGMRKLLKIIFSVPSLLKTSCDIIMLPAHNGLLVITPVLSFFNKFARKKLHYAVIGGWLPEYLDEHKFVAKLLRKNFKGIYVETSVMERDLKERNFNNVYILPNYKDIDAVDEAELSMLNDFPIKACTFSRVTEKKGITEAIKVVTEINAEMGKTAVTLDIYGSVDEAFKSEFELLMTDAPNYIKYKGAVDFDKTVQTLENYDLQLFPTKFITEGIPGSVVESFFAGVPVVASKWNSFEDVIEDGVTGVGFEFGNYDDFKDKLRNLICDYEKINQMKINCVHAAEGYRAMCLKSLEKYFD